MKRNFKRKLHRELKRIVPKALETLAEPFRHLTFLPMYELRKKHLMVVNDGDISLGDEVAIFLIFPSKGILNSHLLMLNSLIRSGITPVVVSNVPLTEPDRRLLLCFAFKLIERPNIGYDFGGYRDGVLLVSSLLPKLDRLWILNDSAWLVEQEPSWFEAARATKKDFVATVSNRGIHKVDIEEHTKISWIFNSKNRKFHYVSNSWCLGARIISDPSFLRFWKRLQIRQSKQLTVRRGEIGFSQWVIRKGFTHGATIEVNELDKELESMPDTQLQQATRNLLMIDPAFEIVKRRVLELDVNSVEGRSQRISLCLAAVARYGAIIAMPHYYLQCKKLPFFKKSIMSASTESAQLALEIMEGLPGELGKDIRSEAKELFLEKDC